MTRTSDAHSEAIAHTLVGTTALTSAPDPEVRRLLQELVKSQRRTDRWMIVLTVPIVVLTAATVLIALLG